ncbi:MAG: late competence development ComFB family protein [Gammaproteobacteria bacterium]|nr:late competence development ComFB family protein [Gammaproteobacteria bacterium]
MAFENIANYYEQLVFNEIKTTLKAMKRKADEDLMEDIACVALNRLPSRYVRHHVDLIFYLSAEEHAHIAQTVRNAVTEAIQFVDQHRR